MRLTTHGVSHVDVARQMEVCPTQFSRWMTGRVNPSLESMLHMEQALDQILYHG
jgi:transcriptional regulator with XRE-family HTH domain